MAYHFTTTLIVPFADAVARTNDVLKRHGFGVLTEIDVQATLKNKLGVKLRPYRILGACNPQMAYRALRLEDKIGTMLPCNVVVQQREDGSVEVSAVDPVASMQGDRQPAARGNRTIRAADAQGGGPGDRPGLIPMAQSWFR